MSATATATVIPFRPRTGRPSLDAQLDNIAHRAEELAKAEQVKPLLRRAEMFAVEVGPAAYQVIAGIIAWHRSHEARWSAPDGDAA